MDEQASPAATPDEPAIRSSQPKVVRAVGWIWGILAGAWGVVDELSRGRDLRPLFLVTSFLTLVAGVALVRGRLWGYWLTIASLLYGLVTVMWFFFLHGAPYWEPGYQLWSRLLVGIPVLAVAVILPLALLLRPSSRDWYRDARGALYFR